MSFADFADAMFRMECAQHGTSGRIKMRPMSRRRARLLRKMHQVWNQKQPKTMFLAPEAYAIFVAGLESHELRAIPFYVDSGRGIGFKGAKVLPRKGGLQ